MNRSILGFATFALLLGSMGRASAGTFMTLDLTSLGTGSTITGVAGVSGNNVVGNYSDTSGVSRGFLYNGSIYATLDATGGGPSGTMGT